MEELAETWSMTSSVNVKMGGKEKLATPVSSALPKRNRCALIGSLNLLAYESTSIKDSLGFPQVTASVMRRRATTGGRAMTRGTLSSACVLWDGKEPLVT